MLQENFGVLSTMSIDVPGYPFGSVTPFCVDRRNRPILYISTIAQHTKNILADPRVSLTVLDSQSASSDVQANGRITVLANALPVNRDEIDVRDRYLRYFPSAVQYDQTHDFMFFRLEPVRARFIGGFGMIFWVDADELRMENPFSPAEESMILSHMNRDHADALKHYANGEAVMVGIDSEGFDVLQSGQSGKKLRFGFEQPVRSMEDARHAMAAMARS